MKKIDKTGETNVNNCGSKMIITKYENYDNIIVKFEDGYETITSYNKFEKGSVKSPYDKSVFNVGYIGEGNYKVSEIINGKYVATIQYQYWNHMLQRCYDENMLIKRPTYEDKYVCEEWLCFQTFAKWFDENYYTIENDRMNLDKDILYKGNKVYSKNTCIFVPNRINLLFTKRQNDRGEYPIGVGFHNRDMTYYAQCTILDANNKRKNKSLGSFNTPNDAFYEGYKPFKEVYIKKVANDYKNIIPIELYNAMINYIVEITD